MFSLETITLIDGIKVIHKLMQTKNNMDAITTNARKSCCLVINYTNGKAKMCKVPDIYRAFSDILRSYFKNISKFQNSFLFGQTNPKRQFIFKQTGNL